jgi:hypothetical protein
MELPIKFKYFTLSLGVVVPTTEGQLPFDGYVLEDENGIQVAGGTSLGGLVAHAQQNDITREVAEQFVTRKLEGFGYLDEINIDAAPEAPSGLMVPPHMLPPGQGRKH